MKQLFFTGTAREDLAAFPEPARRAAGYALFMVQAGNRRISNRCRTWGRASMRFGSDHTSAFRVIYVAKFEDAVYVLHAFHKKARKTSRLDIELAKRRYRLIGVTS